MPDTFIDAANFGDLSAWTDEIVELIKADGIAFLGQVKDCGVIVDSFPLLPPATRDAPSQFQDAEHKVERLTVTQADLERDRLHAETPCWLTCLSLYGRVRYVPHWERCRDTRR